MRQFLSFLVVTTSVFCAASLHAQSLEGIHIGDNASVLDALKESKVGEDNISDYDISLFKLKDNNTLSITNRKNGTIIYMEKDWVSDEVGQKAGFGSFVFAETTLQDALQTFSHSGRLVNGEIPMRQMPDGSLAAMPVYDIDGTDQVVSFIFLASGEKLQKFLGKDNSNIDDLAKMMTLEAMVVTTAPVLSTFWGKEMIGEKATPIKWQDQN